jgi:hypothetical protein
MPGTIGNHFRPIGATLQVGGPRKGNYFEQSCLHWSLRAIPTMNTIL